MDDKEAREKYLEVENDIVFPPCLELDLMTNRGGVNKIVFLKERPVNDLKKRKIDWLWPSEKTGR